MKEKIPQEIKEIVEKLKTNGFQAFIVGGCVRDLLRGKKPNDWDIATNALPKQIQKIFPLNFYENKFGTVTVLTESKDKTLKEVEITPFRKEGKYLDRRHPAEIVWAKTIEEDLARRDFTINAIALDLENKKPIKIIDPFKGKEDLKRKLIRAVGNPEKRFNEDALRMMRAVRFAVSLGRNWQIEEKTKKAIKRNSQWLRVISKERIRDELIKIIMSDQAAKGIELLRELKLLRHIIPELEEGVGVTQNKHHIYTCYQHSLRSLDFAAKKRFNLYVRLAALFHDIGKPRVKRGEGPEATFYNHEVVGAKMTAKILSRLRFPKKDIEKITKLVRYHLFYYHPDEVSESSVRRLIRKVGRENMDELIQVRMADRIGSGVPKAEPYKLRYLRYVIDKVSQDPISVKMLKVSGHNIMKLLNIPPGPKVGQILDILLGYVLEDPKRNNKDFLVVKIKELGKLNDKELKEKAERAREHREKIEQKRDEMTKRKYWLI